METEATGEPAVTIEMSETDTESFEDLGPRVALANGGITQAEVTTIPSVEEIPVGTLINSTLDPPTVNISNASLTVPATSGVVRRSIDVDSRASEATIAAAQMVHQIVSTGKEKATTWVKAYANLDNLRPHFDVEPRTVVNRLIQSFVPITDLSSPEKVPTELYGPLVTSLTLVAVLQMNMKTSNTSLEEATLIETALTTCFGYWAFLTGVIIGLSYLCSTYINKIQACSIAGYGMVSHVVVSFLAELFHTDRTPFFMFWFTICGASSARMATVIASRTVGVSQRILASSIIIFFHMTFLLYLHFSYHHILDEIVEVVEHIEEALDIE